MFCMYIDFLFTIFLLFFSFAISPIFIPPIFQSLQFTNHVLGEVMLLIVRKSRMKSSFKGSFDCGVRSRWQQYLRYSFNQTSHLRDRLITTPQNTHQFTIDQCYCVYIILLFKLAHNLCLNRFSMIFKLFISLNHSFFTSTKKKFTKRIF